MLEAEEDREGERSGKGYMPKKQPFPWAGSKRAQIEIYRSS